MDAGELGLVERGRVELGARAEDEVDDARREACLLEERAACTRRRAPGSRPASTRPCCPSVPGTSAGCAPIAVKLNGVSAKTKPSSGRSSSQVPDAGRRDRLLLVDAREDCALKRRKSIISHAASISAWWAGLRLVEHRRRVQRRAPRPGEQLGRTEEDRDALVPRSRRPLRVGVARGGDRALDVGCVAFRDVGEHVRAVVRHDGLEGRARLDALAADHERDREALARHLGEPAVQVGALGRAGGVRPHRLVDGRWHAEDRRGAHGAIVESGRWT